MSFFTKSRNCNAVPVYTSCEGLPIKLSQHACENSGNDGHVLPLWAIGDALQNPRESTAQDDGRTRLKSKDGYVVVVSAKQTSLHVPVVTCFKKA